jgi:hypothetical protein
MANLLLEELPYSIKVGETEYDIEPDYRVMAKFEQGILTGDRGDKKAMSELLVKCLVDFYKHNIPSDVKEAVDKMWWFYRCGEPLNSKINAAGTRNYKRLYDYDIDAPLIVSAFADTYSVDIISIKMHWWQFKAYFMGLSDETRFVKIMSYRGLDLSEFKGKQKKYYAKLQKKYELPEIHQTPMTLQERDEAFIRSKFGKIRGE